MFNENHEDCTGREKKCQDNKDQLSATIKKLNGEIDAEIETKKSLENRIDTLTSQSGDQVKGLEIQLEAKDIEVDEMNKRIKELEIALGDEQKNVSTLSQSEEACNQDKVGLNTEISNIQASKEESEQACNQAKTGLNTDITTLQKSKTDCENRVNALQRDVEEANVSAKNSVAELGTKIAGL